VRDVTTDSDDAGIVTAVIGMGKNLHMRVVTEGVETKEQLEFLKEHDCPQGQGFLLLPTASAVELGESVHRGLGRTAAA
jgi:EAL domain-containing protein (putative c-di-GMP-specific phosphodiesterase class I)